MLNYANAEKINELGSSIISKANEYGIEINKLFDKLLNISNNGVWTGNKASEYVDIQSVEKQQYLDFYNSLKEFGMELINISNDVNDCIRITENGQEYKL